MEDIIDYIGDVHIIYLIVLAIIGFVAYTRRIFPILYRLGKGLAKRKISIFAKGDNLISSRDLLLHSRLFDKKNILKITKKEDFELAEKATLFLIFWHDFKDNIDEILHIKKEETAIIIYSPYKLGKIPDDQMEKLESKRNVAVSNFRGRLLNDIVISMITASYEK